MPAMILVLDVEQTGFAAMRNLDGIQGELYPCKPDIFAATYEAVERDA